MKAVFPNYGHSIMGVSNSLLKHYGFSHPHESLEVLDQYLERDYENVILLLYDGMGSNLLEKVLAKDSFLRSHQVDTIDAIFPPTTTASTTTLFTGLEPKEHGWLGWDLYFKEEDKMVTMFLNTLKDSDIKVEGESLAHKYYGYTTIFDIIRNKYPVYELYSFKNDYKDLDDRNHKILELTKKPGKKFIYSYDEEPDHLLHKLGINHPKVVSLWNEINQKTEELCNLLNDSLIIVIADHGHIESSAITLKDYPEIFSLLRKDIAIEPRACAFFVEEGKNREFEDLFEKNFGKDFLLYTKEEVIANNFFGRGEAHPRFEESLGDYLAIAISDKYFRYDEHGPLFQSMHAGITEDEVKIPLIIVTKNRI